MAEFAAFMTWPLGSEKGRDHDTNNEYDCSLLTSGSSSSHKRSPAPSTTPCHQTPHTQSATPRSQGSHTNTKSRERGSLVCPGCLCLAAIIDRDRGLHS